MSVALPPDEAMAQLKAAVADFRKRDQSTLTEAARGEELREVRSVMDSLEEAFCSSARTFQVRSGHLAEGAPSAIAWLRINCKMSGTSAADRLCVGKELESLPQIAQALASGEIGYQSAAVVCHLRDQLEDKRDLFDEVEMLELAREHTVHNLRLLCRYARHAADPDGFCRDEEENFERRRLHISPLADGMHVIDGVLDPVGGAAVRTALEALATGDPRTTASTRSGWPTLWSSSPTTPWTRAGCRPGAASGLTST
jgi:uncharacterized protein DUF222